MSIRTKLPSSLGPTDDSQEILVAEVGVDVESELGQLQRDGGLRLVGVDFRQALGILGCCPLGFGPIGHAFPEQVERDPEPAVVQLPGHVQGFFGCVSSDEASGHAAREREFEQDVLEVVPLAQKQECMFKHQLSIPMGADGFARYAWNSSTPNKV